MSFETSAELIRSAVLGVIQGATEFLPVSSSGHLVIVPELLGWAPAGLTFDIAVHIATAIAVLIAFRRDWLKITLGTLHGLRSGSPLSNPDARLLCLLVVATLPAAVAGLLVQPYVESLLSDRSLLAARFSAAMLLVTGTILYASERITRRRGSSEATSGLTSLTADRITFGTALLIGIAQAVAIVPGISRSGTTIAVGLGLGLPREESARFSFLLATPIIIGAGALQAVDVLVGDATEVSSPLALLIGASAAGIVGLASVGWLMRTLRTRSLIGFAIYTWVFGLFALLMLW